MRGRRSARVHLRFLREEGFLFVSLYRKDLNGRECDE